MCKSDYQSIESFAKSPKNEAGPRKKSSFFSSSIESLISIKKCVTSVQTRLSIEQFGGKETHEFLQECEEVFKTNPNERSVFETNLQGEGEKASFTSFNTIDDKDLILPCVIPRLSSIKFKKKCF